MNGIGTEMALYKELKDVPQDKVRNFRNDMYVVSEALRLMQKSGNPEFSTADAAVIWRITRSISTTRRSSFPPG